MPFLPDDPHPKHKAKMPDPKPWRCQMCSDRFAREYDGPNHRHTEFAPRGQYSQRASDYDATRATQTQRRS